MSGEDAFSIGFEEALSGRLSGLQLATDVTNAKMSARLW
jgi:hypothetical protein